MRYRSPRVFCLGGWSPLLPTRFLVSRGTLDPDPQNLSFAYRAVTCCGLPFQVVRLNPFWLVSVLNPSQASLSGLGCPLFARRYWGNLCWLLFLRVLRCFSSPGLPPIVKAIGNSALPLLGCPIRTSMGLCLLATYHGFSQLIASFFGSWRLGIHRMPLVAWLLLIH